MLPGPSGPGNALIGEDRGLVYNKALEEHPGPGWVFFLAGARAGGHGVDRDAA